MIKLLQRDFICIYHGHCCFESLRKQLTLPMDRVSKINMQPYRHSHCRIRLTTSYISYHNRRLYKPVLLIMGYIYSSTLTNWIKQILTCAVKLWNVMFRISQPNWVSTTKPSWWPSYLQVRFRVTLLYHIKLESRGSKYNMSHWLKDFRLRYYNQ